MKYQKEYPLRLINLDFQYHLELSENIFNLIQQNTEWTILNLNQEVQWQDIINLLHLAQPQNIQFKPLLLKFIPQQLDFTLSTKYKVIQGHSLSREISNTSIDTLSMVNTFPRLVMEDYEKCYDGISIDVTTPKIKVTQKLINDIYQKDQKSNIIVVFSTHLASMRNDNIKKILSNAIAISNVKILSLDDSLLYEEIRNNKNSQNHIILFYVSFLTSGFSIFLKNMFYYRNRVLLYHLYYQNTTEENLVKCFYFNINTIFSRINQ